MKYSTLLYWIAYSLIAKNTSQDIKKINSRGIQCVMQEMLSKKMLASLFKGAYLTHALRWVEKNSNHIITLEETDYPEILKKIYNPPALLYVSGKKEILHTLQLAVIGSRKASFYGLETTRLFVKEISQNGFTVTSGLALGIDGESHKTALLTQNNTIAVLGQGLSSEIYPKKHKNLADSIIENGCLLSEFPLETPPLKKNFPRRNRVISGISLATLVIEAAFKSGSLITAHYAAEQGREVFCVPGSILHGFSAGCHSLIKEGAILIESPKELLEQIKNIPIPLHYIPNTSLEIEKVTEKLSQEEKELLFHIDYEGTPLELLQERSMQTLSQLSSTLLSLELKKYILSTTKNIIRKR